MHLFNITFGLVNSTSSDSGEIADSGYLDLDGVRYNFGHAPQACFSLAQLVAVSSQWEPNVQPWTKDRLPLYASLEFDMLKLEEHQIPSFLWPTCRYWMDHGDVFTIDISVLRYYMSGGAWECRDDEEWLEALSFLTADRLAVR